MSVVSILGWGGCSPLDPFAGGERRSDDPRLCALERAQGLIPETTVSSFVETDNLLETLRSFGETASPDRLLFLVSADRKWAVVATSGEVGGSLARLISGEGTPADPPKGESLLVFSGEWQFAGKPGVRVFSGLSPEESLASALAALAEKVVPRAGSSDSVRPWFSVHRSPRRCYLSSDGGWMCIQESDPEAAGVFPVVPPVFGAFLAADSISDLKQALQDCPRTAVPLFKSGVGVERIAVLAATREKFLDRVERAIKKLEDPSWKGSPRNLIFRRTLGADESPRIAWLFDGQGSQHYRMMADLIVQFPEIRKWLENYARIVEPDRDPLDLIFPWEGQEPGPKEDEYLHSMEGGASVAFILNLSLAKLLRKCGVPAAAMAGHSNGENSALIAGGVLRMDDETVLNCCKFLISEATHDEGVEGRALAVSLEDRNAFNRIIAAYEGSVFLALDNCPHQVILFGLTQEMDAIREELEETGAVCTSLPFQRPFHTPWFEEGARGLAPFYEMAPIGVGDTDVYSCAHLNRFTGSKAAIISKALSQFHLPVRFRELIRMLSQEQAIDAFVEVGPGISLKAFVDDTLGAGHGIALSSSKKSESCLSFLAALGDLFVRGVDVDLAPFRGITSSLPASLLDEHIPSENEPTSMHSSTGGQQQNGGVDLLRQHFALMNEFLASQKRVFESCFGSKGAAPEATASENGLAAGCDLPWPMLGENVRREEGRLTACRAFNLETDPFLLDHTLGRRASRRRPGLYGLPVLPFTFSMELLAEAASCLCGEGWVVTSLEDVRGHRWLAVDKEALQVRIEAKEISSPSDPTRKVMVTVFESAESGVEKKAFEGEVHLGRFYPPNPKPRFTHLQEQPPKRLNVPDFYRFGMFHGPRFQNIRRVKHLSAEHVDADLQVFFLDDFFSSGESPRFQLSPNLLDCAGQLTAYSMLENVNGYYGLFPFRVGALRIYAAPPASGTRIRARGELEFDGDNTTMDFDYCDSSGKVLFRLEQKQQRCFEFPKRYHMATFWPESGDGLGSPWLTETGCMVERVEGISHEFLDQGWSIWKRALAHMILDAEERKVFHELPLEGPRRVEWLLGRAAAKAAIRRWARAELDLEIDSADIRIEKDSAGRPYAVCPEISQLATMPTLSISHARDVAIAAISPEGNGIGIDLERPAARPVGDWLRSAFSDAECSFAAGGDLSILLRFWCAKEAAAKALGTGLAGRPEDWPILGFDSGNVVRVGHRDHEYAVSLYDTDGETVALCQIKTLKPASA